MDKKLQTAYGKLFTAADAYSQAQPWVTLAGELPICVENPRTGERSTCISMGASGIVRGLAVYLGDIGRASYNELMGFSEIETAVDTWSLQFQHCLKLEFVDAREKTDYTKQLHKALGLRYRGKLSQPQAEFFSAGWFPTNELTEEQILHLTECLEVVTIVATKSRREIDNLYEMAHTGYHDYVFQWQDGQWESHFLAPPEVAPFAMLQHPKVGAMILPRPAKGEAGQRIALAGIPQGTPTMDHEKGKVFFPTVLVALDADNGMVLTFETFTPNTLQTDLGDWLAEVIRAYGPVNELIPCSDDPTEHLVAGFAKQYGFETRTYPGHPLFEEIILALSRFL